MTGYNLYSTRDYMRCVCDSWGQDEEDCLPAVVIEDPDVTFAVMGVGAQILATVISSVMLITLA